MNQPATTTPTDNSISHMLHVMVVDDQQSMRTILRQLLRQVGMENITEAENGLHAVRLLGVADVPPDVILCDLYMDEMDGMEFVHHLRRAKNPTPVLILTGEKNEFMHEVTEQAGADKVLTKPISAPDLAKEIHYAVGAM